MSMIKRISDMAKATVGNWLDQVENPVLMLNHYIREMEQEVAKAETTVAAELASERANRARHEEAVAAAAAAEQDAVALLKEGDEVKARAALERKLKLDAKAAEHAELFTQAKVRADELALKLGEMRESLEQMRTRKQELTARAEAASVKRQMAGVTANPHAEGGAAVSGYRRIEQHIMQMEAQADLAEALRASADQAAAGKVRKVDDAMEALKQRVAASSN